ncbi:MAG: SDR family oxidoreductase, partial [Ignavibacteria bacterium]|nr:SDR family oxidoreductase [Ignavibacteria bacterium]
RLLHESGVPVLEFRASVVIGSGSLSFEMIRALVERLPVMITPRWVSTQSQPIAIDDLLKYLALSLDHDFEGHVIFEIGGADQMSYGDLMREYAKQRELRRLMIPVPVLTPRLSSLWLGLVTPLYARTGRKLVESLKHPTIVRDRSADSAFDIHPRGVRQSISDALKNEDREFAETRWSDALSSSGEPTRFGGMRLGNRLVDQRTASVRATPEQLFRVVSEIGGERGWYYGNWLWRLRGFLDLLVGGVGMRRGRRDPRTLRVGDVVDWWRVELVDEDIHLRLAAEMRLPGRAWLEFTVRPEENGSILTQTALFDPVGLAGVVYWYAVYPLHVLVFRGMLKGITEAAEAASRQEQGQ